MVSLINIICVIIILLIVFCFQKNERFVNESGFNKCDKVMYINLKKREDRNKQIQSELKKIGVNQDKIIRIDAIYEKYNGHIGCAKSHVKALELAKAMNLKNVVIFEDDFIFTLDKNEVNNKIDNFFKDYNDRWDIVQLTTVHNNLEKCHKDYVKKVNSATTSSGYIINSKFYKPLINNINEAISHMEKEMIEFHKENPETKKYETGYALDQYWHPLQTKSDWFIFYPYLGKQGGEAGASTIMGSIENFCNKIEMFRINV